MKTWEEGETMNMGIETGVEKTCGKGKTGGVEGR